MKYSQCQQIQHILPRTALTCQQKGSGVGAKLVPKAGEEVDKLEGANGTTRFLQRVEERGGDDEEDEASQETNGLMTAITNL